MPESSNPSRRCAPKWCRLNRAHHPTAFRPTMFIFTVSCERPKPDSRRPLRTNNFWILCASLNCCGIANTCPTSFQVLYQARQQGLLAPLQWRGRARFESSRRLLLKATQVALSRGSAIARSWCGSPLYQRKNAVKESMVSRVISLPPKGHRAPTARLPTLGSDLSQAIRA